MGGKPKHPLRSGAGSPSSRRRRRVPGPRVATAQGSGKGRTSTGIRSSAAERLSEKIESLQAAFRQLSPATNVRDLAARFAKVVLETYPGGAVDLLFRSAGSQEWQHLVAGNGAGLAADIAAGPLSALCTVRHTGPYISAVQKLVDGALAGITLERADPRGGPGDSVTMQLLGHLFDTAYQELLSRRNEKELIFSLNHRVLQLNSLIDTGIEVSKLDQDTSPHQLALQRAASLTNASKGVVRVQRGGEPAIEIMFPAGITHVPSDAEGRCIKTGFTFDRESYIFELYDKESRAGVLPFDETDQLLLDALARQVHASLENRYLHKQALEKQRLEQDLAVAASIQQRILPAVLPAISGYDIAGINIPSRSVGGDYYDCIPLPDGTYALVVADVAGKGMPAALLVSSLQAYLRAYLETGIPLVDLVRRLNRAIYNASTDDKFITAFLGIFSPESGGMESVNAGHNPAYWLKSDRSVVELNAGGIALGMLDIDFPYQSERTMLGRGERLLFYTDGIPEAVNQENKLYESSTPLQKFVADYTPDRAGSFIDGLIEDIRGFTGETPQSDDITALYLLRHP